ncbi:MAG: cache domain-containing protein [Desulfobacteraceae bacterium]|nr:cache domain-containing protein [Desulfobacteraceae bacterium]
MDDTNERLEVRHWVQKAIRLFNSDGREEILSRISDPRGPLVDGRRYVFALSMGGELLAHPFSKQLVGSNLIDRKDSGGKSFIRKLLETAKNRGYGFIEYEWPTPDSRADLHKTLFFERVDGMVLCSGFYSEKEHPLEAIFRCFQPYGPA